MSTPDPTLTDQPTSTPTPKVLAATVGAAFAAVIVGLAVWLGAADPPPGFEGGLGAALTFIFGWLKRDRATSTNPAP